MRVWVTASCFHDAVRFYLDKINRPYAYTNLDKDVARCIFGRLPRHGSDECFEFEVTAKRIQTDTPKPAPDTLRKRKYKALATRLLLSGIFKWQYSGEGNCVNDVADFLEADIQCAVDEAVAGAYLAAASMPADARRAFEEAGKRETEKRDSEWVESIVEVCGGMAYTDKDDLPRQAQKYIRAFAEDEKSALLAELKAKMAGTNEYVDKAELAAIIAKHEP